MSLFLSSSSTFSCLAPMSPLYKRRVNNSSLHLHSSYLAGDTRSDLAGDNKPTSSSKLNFSFNFKSTEKLKDLEKKKNDRQYDRREGEPILNKKKKKRKEKDNQ